MDSTTQVTHSDVMPVIRLNMALAHATPSNTAARGTVLMQCVHCLLTHRLTINDALLNTTPRQQTYSKRVT